AAGRWVHPDPILDPDRLVAGIARLARDRGVRVVLPMEETTLLALLDRRKRLPAGTTLYGPEPEVIRRLSDKVEAASLLSAAGFPVPATSPVPDGIRFPAVVKPRSASGAAGVAYVDDEASCRAAHAAAVAAHGSALVQEFVPGRGVGVSLLIAREGDLVAAFAHRRLRERPATGGASTQRVSVALPAFVSELAATLAATGFFGPVHVEFREDERDGVLRPIEINPRYWGSLALAVHAGVPFPSLHARLAMGEHPRPILDYAVGVRCRWFLFGDLQIGLQALARGRWREAAAALGPRGPFDILSLDDPGPAMARLAAPLAWMATPGLRLLLRHPPA
ncbi:MAG: ATP-grasp domain-containing protein, partial [Planctomycetota bacterium]